MRSCTMHTSVASIWRGHWLATTERPGRPYSGARGSCGAQRRGWRGHAGPVRPAVEIRRRGAGRRGEADEAQPTAPRRPLRPGSRPCPGQGPAPGPARRRRAGAAPWPAASGLQDARGGMRAPQPECGAGRVYARPGCRCCAALAAAAAMLACLLACVHACMHALRQCQRAKTLS